MALSVILVEADVVSPAGVASTLRFSDRAIFPLAPSDPDRPNLVWDDRLVEPPSLKRTLFDDLETLEPGLGVGVMTLANADRALDPYQGHVWGEVRVWRWIYGSPFSTAKTLLTGPAGGTPSYDVGSGKIARVRLTLYDYRLELERPLQSAAYGGANDVDAEIYFDGEEGLKGELKPLAYGDLRAAQVPAPLVNNNATAYQLHDGPIVTTGVGGYNIQIFDRGGDAGLENGGDVSADVATDKEFYYFELYPELPDNPFDPRGPGGGELPPVDPGEGGDPDPSYDLPPPRWHARTEAGIVKMNGNLVGNIAFGFKGDASGTGYVETPGPIVARLLARLGVPAPRIGASVAAVDCDSVVGAYFQDAIDGRQAVGWLSRSAPMAVLPDRLGVWQATLLAPPAAEPAFTLAETDLLALEADEAAPRGAGEFSVGWDRIWTTYRREALQPALLNTTAETRLLAEYRYASAEDAAYKARHPSAWRKMKLDTPLRAQADAEALAALLKTLFGLRPDGRPRRQWRATIEMTDAVLDVPLGATVALSAPKYGVDDRFLLVGEEPLRPRRDRIIWTLWG